MQQAHCRCGALAQAGRAPAPASRRAGTAVPVVRAVQRLQDRLPLGVRRTPSAASRRDSVSVRVPCIGAMIRPHDHGPGDVDAWAAHARGRVADAATAPAGPGSAVSDVAGLRQSRAAASAPGRSSTSSATRWARWVGIVSVDRGARTAGEPGAGGAPRPGAVASLVTSRLMPGGEKRPRPGAWVDCGGVRLPSRTIRLEARARAGPAVRRTHRGGATTWSCAGVLPGTAARRSCRGASRGPGRAHRKLAVNDCCGRRRT